MSELGYLSERLRSDLWYFKRNKFVQYTQFGVDTPMGNECYQHFQPRDLEDGQSRLETTLMCNWLTQGETPPQQARSRTIFYYLTYIDRLVLIARSCN